jgi:CO/xanthine dehydrogenase Mo-binding subunit
LQDGAIRFSAQPIALVVAEDFGVARHAASLVQITYDRADHVTELNSMRSQAFVPHPWEILPPVPQPRGDARRALETSSIKCEAEYRLPIEHHNPIESFGTTVVFEADGRLTVYDKTQGVQNVQGYLCSLLGYDKARIRVLAPFVGGAFGLGLRPQYQAFLAALAAHVLHRSVRVTLTRQQMFGLGYRPETWQRVSLGAAPDGRLTAVWGIGMALEEESLLDQTFGRFMNHSLGEYHVPVNADIHGIDVIFVEEFDEIVNPLGAKGLGEIGVVGVASAIANAVYNATGVRIRRLPITLDNVL